MKKNILKDLIEKALKENKIPADIKKIPKELEAASKMHKGQAKRLRKAGIKEAEITAGSENTKFNLKVDVSNKQSETKLGIRIQLTPKEGFLEPDLKDKLEIVISKKLNNSLEQFDIQVSKDTDVPNPEVIGFFIPLSQIKNMIVSAVKGPGTPTPAKPPLPSATPQQKIDTIKKISPKTNTKPLQKLAEPLAEQLAEGPDGDDMVDKLRQTLISWEQPTYKGGVEGCDKSNH